MKRIALKGLLGGVVLTVGLLAGLSSDKASANEFGYPPQYPAMMQNYYVQDYQQGINAEMYVAPVPTPPIAGRTYITYPALNPHEFLYRHKRTYYHYYDGGRGLNRTKIHWYGGKTFLKPFNPLF